MAGREAAALDVERYGQVFTPGGIVHKMLSLRRNSGRILEPSCGDGAFLSALEKDAVGVKIDGTLNKDKRVVIGDFFAYPPDNKFDTIIGNPPYVRYQDIADSTKGLLNMDLFDRRSNLYLFFICKCIDHLPEGGELIFITPRDFIKATSSCKLNEKLYHQGSMTHFYDLGRRSRKMKTGGEFCHSNGQLWFGEKTAACVADYFDIKVGAVSGADDVFISEKRGNVEMVCSTTIKDRRVRQG